jgi:hypothetical protein
MIPSIPSLSPYPWQDERRLQSGDRVWIITDVASFSSSLYPWSSPQKWYRVGGLDLSTMRLGYFTFSTDDVRALLKAGVVRAPWKVAQRCGFKITRLYHGPSEEGRFREKVKLVELEADLLAQGPMLRRYFEKALTFQGNSEPGMWDEIEDWARRQNVIEATALAMPDWFSAGDVKRIVETTFGTVVNVSPALAVLVGDGLLLSNGKKTKAARYMVAPTQIVERADWSQ